MKVRGLREEVRNTSHTVQELESKEPSQQWIQARDGAQPTGARRSNAPDELYKRKMKRQDVGHTMQFESL